VTCSFLSHLECSRTGDRYDADEVQGVTADVPVLAKDGRVPAQTPAQTLGQSQ
jgi:threonine synthase